MPSPFPGMDPYIEHSEIRADFHNNLAPEIQGQLNRIIRPRYVARLIPRVILQTVISCAFELQENVSRKDAKPAKDISLRLCVFA